MPEWLRVIDDLQVARSNFAQAPLVELGRSPPEDLDAGPTSIDLASG